MAPSRLNRPSVRPRPEDEEDTVESEIESEETQDSGESFDANSDNSSGDNNSEETAEDSSDPSDVDDDEENGPPLQNISFRALAKAQASLGTNPRKRKLGVMTDNESKTVGHRDQSQSGKTSEDATRPRKLPKDGHSSRSSKHAPMALSSRHAVSRRRDIFEPSPSLKSRDPRFDPTITTASSSHNNPSSATAAANKAYAFLTTYRAAELAALKAQLVASKSGPTVNTSTTDALKRQVASLESKSRAAEAAQRERELRAQHTAAERAAIRSGAKSKPYYLKDSEVKRAVLAEKFQGLGKRAREKVVERRRKRVMGREGREMPRTRRKREPG